MKKILFFILFTAVVAVIVVSGVSARQTQTICYPYGTPNTINSGVVCPFVEEMESDTPIATETPIPPTVTAIASPTNIPPTNMPPTVTVTSAIEPTLSLPYVTGSTIGIIADDVGRQGNEQIYFNSWNGGGLDKFPHNTFGTVDLTGKIPSDAKAVFLSGLLVITHGTTVETCDMHIYFRRSSTVPEWTYIGQSVEAHVGGGQRQPMFVILPVENSKLQFKWYGSTFTNGNYPEHCSYGVSFRIAGYIQ